MKRSVLCLTLILISGLAVAECHMRSDIRIKRENVWAGPTDLQRLVTPDEKGKKCVIRYRVNLEGDWHTAEGQGTGTNDADACRQALDINSGYVLQDLEPTNITADSQLVCSDLNTIRVRPVRIGETIWESETNVHPIRAERGYFKYKFTTCRMFSERAAKSKNFYTYQGVICRLTDVPGSRWVVVDKY